MSSTKIRKEVTLDTEVIEKLKVKAKIDGRSLKNYMEKVLQAQAEILTELSDEKKSKLDELLNEYEAGTLKLVSEEEFKYKSKRK